MVAAPEKSYHCKGLAVDVVDDGGWEVRLTNSELALYGLYRPLSWEQWHFQVK